MRRMSTTRPQAVQCLHPPCLAGMTETCTIGAISIGAVDAAGIANDPVMNSTPSIGNHARAYALARRRVDGMPGYMAWVLACGYFGLSVVERSYRMPPAWALPVVVPARMRIT